MRVLVRFRASDTAYALPVEHVTEVRSASDVTALPAPRAGVAGLVPRGDGALTVLSVLSDAGRHVLVIEQGTLTFGLLVDEVTEVMRVEDDQIGPAPRGQDADAVAGVIQDESGLLLVLDAAALRGMLAT